MRKLLLAATILGLAAAPAFAGGIAAAGDVNIAGTTAASNAGVVSTEGTMAGVKTGGNGAVVVGAVSGNYTAVDTSALGVAGPKGSYTNTTATQTNIGGTVAGGLSGTFFGNAGGSASGGQNSTAMGGAKATANDMNAGGYITVGHGGRTDR
ncbi:MAG TPA: hypothetical protein VMB34_01200 [Acetobacteraceae bacterium]|nr:hypothetical protein [Acetobacteraceae bacterium]